MSTATAKATHAEELAKLERDPRPEKVAEVERLQQVLKESSGVFLTDFRGIDVAKMNELRDRFREEGVTYRVVKNTLLKRAADSAGLSDWIADLEGPVAMAVGTSDPVTPAKVIDKFRDDHKREGEYLAFRGGLVDGAAIEEDTFHRLAALPGRDELIAKLLYLLTYPMRGLVTVLSGLPRGLVYALEDLRGRRAEEAPAEAAAPSEQEEQGDDAQEDAPADAPEEGSDADPTDQE